MTDAAWKRLERFVAKALGGIRAHDTDHDVLIITSSQAGSHNDVLMDEEPSGRELLTWARRGWIELASIEVKNLRAPTVAQLEAFLRKNRAKADRDGIKYSALVVKRKAGQGKSSMALLVVPLEDFALDA